MRDGADLLLTFPLASEVGSLPTSIGGDPTDVGWGGGRGGEGGKHEDADRRCRCNPKPGSREVHLSHSNILKHFVEHPDPMRASEVLVDPITLTAMTYQRGESPYHTLPTRCNDRIRLPGLTFHRLDERDGPLASPRHHLGFELFANQRGHMSLF
jgi:hypothetical protein